MPIFFFLMLRRQSCPCLPSEESSQVVLPAPPSSSPTLTPPKACDLASHPAFLAPVWLGLLPSPVLLTGSPSWRHSLGFCLPPHLAAPLPQKCSLLPAGSQRGEYLCTVLSQPQTLLLSFGLLGWCCNVITHLLSPSPPGSLNFSFWSGLPPLHRLSNWNVLRISRYLPPPCLRVFLSDRVLADYRSVGAVGILNGVILCWGFP